MEGERRYPPNQDSDARRREPGGGDGGVSRDAERGRTTLAATAVGVGVPGNGRRWRHGKSLRAGVFREFAKSRLEVDLAERPRRGRRDVESGERTRRRQPASTCVVVGDFGQHAVVEFPSRALIRSR